MAAVIVVHGTFAHSDSKPASDGSPALEPQWWQTNSTFERDVRDLVDAPDGNLDVKNFEWSGDNSEVGRREAGEKLFARLRDLETKNEPYCLVGHSHGGSVIAAALLASAARKEPLQNLKRWITVGTPFLSLKKERWLLTRLNLMRKVIFVASMMLLLMFLVHMVANAVSGEKMLFGNTFPGVLIAMGFITGLPAILLYFLLNYLDSRTLRAYRARVTKRAKETFGPRWLSLAHSDDEAIQGLALLPDAKLSFFDKSFAVPTITLISVVAAPMLYLAALTSPAAMTGLANWLKVEVYESNASPEAEQALKDLRQQLRDARQAEAQQGATGDGGVAPSREVRRAARSAYRAKHDELEARYPNLASIERGLRFKQRFFQRDGQPCEGGELCGGGRDIAVNSGLMLHVATDELSWALGAAELSEQKNRWIWSLLAPAVLVPLIFGLVALALMLVIQGLATIISRTSSQFFNMITNAEVKRAAFGNDTEGEIATGASDRPSWLERSPPRLPAAVADLLTAYSNGVATQSIAKFRRAIGQIAFAEPQHTADTAVTTYFTWKELVHGAYFDVPEFRKLVAQALSRADGFQPSARFKSDGDYARTAHWLTEIETTPGTTAQAGAGEPGAADAAAVSAVIVSTVKAAP